MSIKVDKKTIAGIYTDYAKGLKVKDEIEVEISEMKSLDILLMLDIMGDKPSVGRLAPILEKVLDGSTITFTYADKVIKSVGYNKGDTNNALHLMFTDAPYLYDLLQQTVYVLLLKKLTPHLEGSN